MWHAYWGPDELSAICAGSDGSVLGKEQLVKIIDYVRQGHNVVLLANHQVTIATDVLEQNKVVCLLVWR
jgi:hypothetical protein